MSQFNTYIGLDVHKDSIAVAVAEAGNEPARFLGTVANDATRLRAKLKRLGSPDRIRICYEAGPTGYGLHRKLLTWGYSCDVIAPGKTPRRATDRIKTDRRDAERLAHFLRSGDLTAIRVPSEEEEAMRDLLRAREDAKQAEKRAKRQLNMFLLRQGRIWSGRSRWTLEHMLWISKQSFEQQADTLVLSDYLHEVRRLTERVASLTKSIEELVPTMKCYPLILALQALRGVKTIVATTLAVEIGDFRRFPTARHFMSFLGVTPSEYSSGGKRQLGAITKAGNVRLRSLLMQASWAYRLKPRVEGTLLRRNRKASQEVRDIAWRAQERLYRKLHRLTAAGKPKNKALVAVGRELAGFIWSIAGQEKLIA